MSVQPARASETEKPPGHLPGYRWAVEKRRVLLRPQVIGLDESFSVYPEGLTVAGNGDLLMAACSPQAGKTFIMRSSDRGSTWKQQGVLEHRGEVQYSPARGCVEGMYMTKSGRLVLIYFSLKEGVYEQTKPGDRYYVPGGNNFRAASPPASRQWGAYSDDEGKTWQYVPMDIKPFLYMNAEACSQIFEEEDGTLVASFNGSLAGEDLDSASPANGVIRSHDGGLSWGDTTPIRPTDPGSGLLFNENQVLPLPDGRWLCMMRSYDLNIGLGGVMSRSYSRDRGRTWTYPVRTQFHGGEPGMGFLPDGAILCTQTGIGWTLDVRFTCAATNAAYRDPSSEGRPTGLLYEVSYDGGLTWSYWGGLYLTEPRSREHVGSPIIRPLDEDTAIAVYHRGEKEGAAKFPDLPSGPYGPQFIGASWLRKAPAGSPEAAGLNYPEWLVEQALQTAIADAEKLVSLPEEWRFQFDKDDRGLVDGWQAKGSFDDWARMRIDKHWTVQGEARLGVAWYATSFDVPETGGIPLMMLFGAVDGYCDVFIDGRKAGEQKVSPETMWNRPFYVPLDGGLAPGRHAMVIRVKKDSWNAGIHKPIWIVAKSSVPLPWHAAVHSGETAK